MSEFEFLEPIPKTLVSIKLPSRGVLYPKDHPASGGKLTLSPMTMMEEALMMTDELTMDQVIDKILKRCLQEAADVNTLIAADKFFLFMMLRAITYGADYSFTWTCNHSPKGKLCGHSNNTTVKIPDHFKVKFLADADKEPFIVRLPESGKEISFRLLRGTDEIPIEEHSKEIQQKKATGAFVVDTTLVFRLAQHLVAIDGNSLAKAPKEKVISFVSSLSAKDRQFLQEKIRYYTPGLDTALNLVCEKCKNKTEMEMPFTASFFRAVYVEDKGDAVADQI